MHKKLADFFKQEYSVGVLLIVSSLLALIAANSSLSVLYDLFLQIPIQLTVGPLDINKPLLLWVNDGLMAVFFLLIGLEVKYEVMQGELSSPAQIALPGFAAIGGMLVPALFYVAFTQDDPNALAGWAIPAATDIAFAVGILALLGKRIPPALKIFLLALAIIDDLGAVIIIALFYTSKLSITSLGLAVTCVVLLALLNRFGIEKKTPYLILGALLWLFVLKSGVHATLAGVVLALTIPLKNHTKEKTPPLIELKHSLHNSVNFIILPIFAFANAGVLLTTDQLATLLNPIPLGIISGLFLGKQIGVFSFCWIAVKCRLAKLPNQTNWLQLYGLAILCGIGFTMSLFIGSLAFENIPEYLATDRIGILSGSLLSGVIGYFVLRLASNKST